jgi:hypothetical protein
MSAFRTSAHPINASYRVERPYYVHHAVLSTPQLFEVAPGSSRKRSKPRLEYPVAVVGPGRDVLEVLEEPDDDQAASVLVRHRKALFNRGEERVEGFSFTSFRMVDEKVGEDSNVVEAASILAVPVRDVLLPNGLNARARAEEGIQYVVAVHHHNPRSVELLLDIRVT